MTQTPNKGYDLPVVGASFGTWGTLLDTDLTTIDTNLGGLASVSVAGNADITATGGQAQNLVQQLTGALTGNIRYILPQLGGFYIIENLTTGNFTVTVVTAALANGTYAPQGLSTYVYSDGTNINPATPQSWQEITAVTAVSANSQSFYLPGNFRRFRLTLQGGSVNTNASSLVLQFSSNGGSSYITTNYAWSNLAYINPTNVSAVGSGTSAANILLAGDLLTPVGGAATPIDMKFEVYPGSASFQPVVTGFVYWSVPGTGFFASTISGNYSGATPALMNAMLITCVGGQFSGVMVLEGLP